MDFYLGIPELLAYFLGVGTWQPLADLLDIAVIWGLLVLGVAYILSGQLAVFFEGFGREKPVLQAAYAAMFLAVFVAALGLLP